MGAIYDDSREFHRINFNTKVNLHFTKNNYPLHEITNLSLTGMFVTGNILVKKNEQCQIYSFYSEKSETKVFRALAKVVRCNNKGVALNFISMPIESYKILVTILVDNTELPEVVLYEFSKICPFDLARS